jgi:hypothetical protein
MDNEAKGNYAEQKVILRAIEKGVRVSKPLHPCRYDLVIDDGKLKRSQIKYADGKCSHTDGAVQVNLRTWDHTGPKKKCKKYSDSEIDGVFVYLPKLDKVLWLDVNLIAGKSAVAIRLEPPKNGQKKGASSQKITFGNGL